MAMVVKNNMSAVNTLNTLNKNQSALSQSLQKVSSGMKINSAGDDASGMAISERMRVQVRSLDQDDKNTKNGTALLRTAEGAVQSTVEVLKTLKEKAINAANDTNTDEDRRLIQKEVDKLIDQIDENALTTYNGKYLIDGSRNGFVGGPGGQGTFTCFTNTSLSTDTTGLTFLTELKRRDGNDLGILPSDTLTASWVKDGVTYTRSVSPIGDTLDIAAAIRLVTESHAGLGPTNELIGMDEYNRQVYTPDNKPGITVQANKAGRRWTDCGPYLLCDRQRGEDAQRCQRHPRCIQGDDPRAEPVRGQFPGSPDGNACESRDQGRLYRYALRGTRTSVPERKRLGSSAPPASADPAAAELYGYAGCRYGTEGSADDA